MSRERHKAPHCFWTLTSAQNLLWCPKLHRWLKPEDQPIGTNADRKKVCKTRAAADRAANGLATLGGGELTRTWGKLDRKSGQVMAWKVVWTILSL